MNICFIGYGNMAKALISCFQKEGQNKLFVTAPSLVEKLSNEELNTHFDNKAFLQQANIIVLAIKPAQVKPVMQEIGPLVPKHCLLVSVVAGVNMSQLAHFCNEKQAIIRCMPNTPITLAKGATALLANSHVTKEAKMQLENLFHRSGLITWVKNEDDINKITALSGSGPAYIFFFIEAMIAGALKLGLEPELAKTFSLQTLAGSLALLESTQLSAQALRQQVTSPGGTTAAALAIFDKENLSELVATAMKAAYERAEELSKS